jgi:thymidylate synthase
LSIPYLEGELDFYLSGSPFLKDIVKYSKFWSRVSDDGRVINSNYGKLLLHDRNFHGYTQFEYARDMLIRNKDSKKAVMTIYNKENAYVSNDNPCTMFLSYVIRDNQLSLYVKMRSSDIWFGLPYDVPFFVLMLYKMYFELRQMYPDLTVGFYNHQAISLHLYERNFINLSSVLSENLSRYDKIDQDEMFDSIIHSRIKNNVIV